MAQHPRHSWKCHLTHIPVPLIHFITSLSSTHVFYIFGDNWFLQPVSCHLDIVCHRTWLWWRSPTYASNVPTAPAAWRWYNATSATRTVLPTDKLTWMYSVSELAAHTWDWLTLRVSRSFGASQDGRRMALVHSPTHKPSPECRCCCSNLYLTPRVACIR